MTLVQRGLVNTKRKKKKKKAMRLWECFCLCVWVCVRDRASGKQTGPLYVLVRRRGGRVVLLTAPYFLFFQPASSLL